MGIIKLTSTLPADFPSDIPLYPGSKFFAIEQGPGPVEPKYIFCADGSIVELDNFYTQNIITNWQWSNSDKQWHTNFATSEPLPPRSESDINEALKINLGSVHHTGYMTNPQTQKPTRELYITMRKGSEEKTVVFVRHKII